jgi:hypothetical protein
VKGIDRRGSSEDNRRRKLWLLDNYRGDIDALIVVSAETGERFVLDGPSIYEDDSLDALLLDDLVVVERVKACRCYMCGTLLVLGTLTVDRIVPGAVKTKMFPKGGTYVRHNIRPACSFHNSSEGARLKARLARGLKR